MAAARQLRTPLAAAACLTAFAAHDATASSGWVDRLERGLSRLSGHVLALPAGTFGGRSPDTVHAVFHAPTSSVWIIGGPEPGAEVLLSGSVHRGGTAARAFVTFTWDSGAVDTWTRPPAIPPAGPVHPLARFHDRLLSAPLARAARGLPAGSRFHAAGTVERPGRGDGPATLWSSLGDHVAVTLPDGAVDLLHWSDLAAALPGGAE